jgi:hypothetical protein
MMWSMTLLIPLLVLTAALEIYIRVARTAAPVYEKDEKLGWKLVANMSLNRTIKDMSGSEYEVFFDTNKYGFREWGNINSSNRIFFVGDSYTADPNTSDSDAYFNIVRNELGAEVFAAGGGGYGTLQELMLVEEYIDIIKPNIFVLQFCENDFVNNGYELESYRFVRNQKYFRPYLVNNEIVYRDAAFYRILRENSKLAARIDAFIQQLQFKRYGGYSPKLKTIEEKKEKEAAYIDAVNTTKQLFSRMFNVVNRYTDNIYSINCVSAGGWKRETQSWLEISKETGFTPLPSVTLEIEKYRKRGEIVKVQAGGHWNIRGNLVVGKELARRIKEHTK